MRTTLSPPKLTQKRRSTARVRVSRYVAGIRSGKVPAGRWVRLAADRWAADLERPDLVMDWKQVERVAEFCRGCGLVGDDHDQDYELLDWQLWVVAGLYGWKRKDTGTRRTRFAVIQVGRGAGKTTFLAAVALYDLTTGPGRRVDIIANKRDQATTLLNTAKTMSRRVGGDLEPRQYTVERKDQDCRLQALTSSEKSLDGLNPSLWIGDEAHEWRGRFATKLTTTGAKRKETLGVVISTPGSNPDNWYADEVKTGQAVLEGRLQLDANQYWLWGIDEADELADESVWPKALPGLPVQPTIQGTRDLWASCSVSKIKQDEFARYKLCRPQYGTGAWLNMDYWSADAVELEALRGRPAWLGLDLSKSFDMSALVACVPLMDGRLAIVGKYWWPKESARDREVEYAMPLRRWESEGRICLTPGREVDYQAIRDQVAAWRALFDVRKVAFDKWGSTYLAQCLVHQDAVPLVEYPMTISTLGPACQVFQNYWVSKRMVFQADEIFRRACADVDVWHDNNGNLRPVKSGRKCIDPLMAGLMAVHSYSLEAGRPPSVYEASGIQ
jgi:phage terminase large subunit-like protein